VSSLADQAPAPPEGIPGVRVPGPFPVGQYARVLRDRLRRRPRVQVFGEVVNLRITRVRVYFELRDAEGALPCSMWRNDLDAIELGAGELADGAGVVVAGGPDYYPGGATASPAFSFQVTSLRLAGEGDLLAQLERLRRRLDAEGLFTPQKRLPRPALPQTIGVVTGEGGKARDDVLAGLARRGWAGRVVWAFAPVQDRHAAGAIAERLRSLAEQPAVEVIVVARGGGSLADLWAFCDETLCRTVALLRVPVIASVGHHTDRTLIDDVAAVACSTPTHAAEVAVPVDVGEAHAAIGRCAGRLAHHGRRSVVERARQLARLSRAPAEHVGRQRTRLHQQTRELRAVTRRRLAEARSVTDRRLLVISRKADVAAIGHARRAATLHGDAAGLSRAAQAAVARQGRELARVAATLAAHDPDRTLERGYALVEGDNGELVTSAAAARRAGTVSVRFTDDRVRARIEEDA